MRQRQSLPIDGGPTLVFYDAERGGALLKWDASGSFSDRALFNSSPKDFTFLVIDPLPFMIYVKRSSTIGDWSAGQVVQPTPAQTTAAAQAAAAAAAQDRIQAQQAATAASTFAVSANTSAQSANTFSQSASASTIIASQKADVATAQASAASVSADVANAAAVSLSGATRKVYERKTLLDFIDPTLHASITNGTISNNVDLSAALASAAAYVAGGYGRLIIPSGLYPYSVSPQWAVNFGRIDIDGEVRFRYTGTGNAFIMNRGTDTSTVHTYNMQVGRPSAPLIIEASASAGHAVFAKAINHSECHFVVRGCGPTKAALYTEGGVCSDYGLVASVNEGGWYNGAKPGYGWIAVGLTGEGGAGQCSYVFLKNPKIEGVANGVSLRFALGCGIVGGTVEGNSATGIDVMNGCMECIIERCDLEANAGFDIRDNAIGTRILSCDSTAKNIDRQPTSGVIIGANSRSILIMGGRYNTILCSVGAVGTRLIGFDIALDADGTMSIPAGVEVIRFGVFDRQKASFISDIGERQKRTLLSFMPVQYRDQIRDGTIPSSVDLSQYMAAAAAYSKNPYSELTITGGVYPYASSPNWAGNNVRINVEGDARFRYTGSDDAFICSAGDVTTNPDGSINAPQFFGMKIGSPGNPLTIEAPPGAKNAAFICAIHRSEICLNARGAGATSSAFNIIFCVCTNFVLIASVNEGGWYLNAVPLYGIRLDRRAGNPSDFSAPSFCTFTSPLIEGVKRGVTILNAGGCRFINGTIEACLEQGLDFTSGATGCTVEGTDFEANGGFDVRDNGRSNALIDIQSVGKTPAGAANSGVLLLSASTGFRIVRGVINAINAVSGAKFAEIWGVQYNIDGNSSIYEVAGPGTVFRIRDAYDFTRQITHDAVPTRSVVTLPDGSYTITNSTRNPQIVTISGSVTSLGFIAKVGVIAGITPVGLVRLDPGEGLYIAYNNASKPTVAICS